jgi:hypothetical protein
MPMADSTGFFEMDLIYATSSTPLHSCVADSPSILVTMIRLLHSTFSYSSIEIFDLFLDVVCHSTVWFVARSPAN